MTQPGSDFKEYFVESGGNHFRRFQILKYFTNFTKSVENNFVHVECENNSVEVKELTHVIMVSW